jgi:hypothetical protein
MKRFLMIVLSSLLLLLPLNVYALAVFPGAEGFGSTTRAAYGNLDTFNGSVTFDNGTSEIRATSIGTGLVAGNSVEVSGSVAEDGVYIITSVAANALTVTPAPGDEGPTANVDVDQKPLICVVDDVTDNNGVLADETENGIPVKAGSLRECVNLDVDNKIIIFDISGHIPLGSRLTVDNDYVTIAGQTAPSPGVTLRDNYMRITESNILMQHMRIRPGGVGSQGVYNSTCGNRDCLQIENAYTPGNSNTIVIDHCSFSWGVDETLSIWYSSYDITVSNCILSEPLGVSCYPNPPTAHFFGFISGSNCTTMAGLRNLVVHSKQRNPMAKDGGNSLVWFNNVIYNYNLGFQGGKTSDVTVEENIYITGPTVANYYPIRFINLTTSANTNIYLSGNVEDDVSPHTPMYICTNCDEPVANYLEIARPIWWTGTTELDAEGGLKDYVLANAGARPSDRDNVDQRAVDDVINDTGDLIDWHTDLGSDGLGGYQALAENAGAWTMPADPHNVEASGYTTLEEWLHDFSEALAPTAHTPYPADGQTGIPLDADLTWVNASNATSIDLFFEASDSTPDVKELDDQDVETWDTGTMTYSTTYYWQLLTNHATGETTGPIWSFTTSGTPPSLSSCIYESDGVAGTYDGEGVDVR